MITAPKKITQIFALIPTNQKERLDQVLVKILTSYSRTQIQNWIETGAIKINGQLVKAKMKVSGKEMVTLDATIEPNEWHPEDLPLSIVFEDEAVLIINKPVGMVVHPAPGNLNHTLLNALLHHAPTLALLPRAGILHRLDKNTSGLLIVAKSLEALKQLQTQLKKRKISREYQAIVFGKMISGGTIDAPIGRHPLKRKTMAVVETGKTAITHYRIAEKYASHTRLNIRLETGRTHQIRVHLAHIHHPIIGDPIYGGRLRLAKNMLAELSTLLRAFKRQALHACAIGFYHPINKEWMRFKIELPDDIKELIDVLKKDNHNKE